MAAINCVFSDIYIIVCMYINFTLCFTGGKILNFIPFCEDSLNKNVKFVFTKD